MKKKYSILLFCCLILALLLSLFIWWKMPSYFFKNTEAKDISRIDVFDGSTGIGFEIKDTEEIEYILSNIQGNAFRKGEISAGKMGVHFSLTFYDEENKKTDKFYVNSDDTIRKDPFFYRTDVNMNIIEFLDELEDSKQIDFDLQVTVPFGKGNEYVYADEEIVSETGYIVVNEVNEFPNAEFVLYPVEKGDDPKYFVPDGSLMVYVETNKAYKLGIKINEIYEDDITLNIKINASHISTN